MINVCNGTLFPTLQIMYLFSSNIIYVFGLDIFGWLKLVLVCLSNHYLYITYTLGWLDIEIENLNLFK